MAPVDAVSPPKKKSTPKKKQQPSVPKKQMPSRPAMSATREPNQKPHDEIQKLKLWLAVGAIMVVIIGVWFVLLKSGSLSSADNDSGLGILGKKISNLWDSIQEDVFNLKDTLDDTAQEQMPVNAEEQRIRELEDALFPEPPSTNSQ